MNTDFSTLCEQAAASGAAVLDKLTYIGATLRDLQGELDKMPFFVRGFATSEISRGTGQDLGAWTKTAAALTGAVTQAQAAVAQARAAGAVDAGTRDLMTSVADRTTAEGVRLESLVAFLVTVPAKLKMAPPGMLPAERREEFLSTIDRQAQALRGTIDALPELAHGLRALAETAA